MNIGERLRDLRKKRKLTQTELGKKIGKCESTIRKYEAGIVEPKLDSFTSVELLEEVKKRLEKI